jgi:hypothetical protein
VPALCLGLGGQKIELSERTALVVFAHGSRSGGERLGADSSVDAHSGRGGREAGKGLAERGEVFFGRGNREL